MSQLKIKKLREILEERQISAFITPTSDPHKSEYIANFWKSREWLTGFSGSAGTAIVTKNHAGLWTDSRYFVQAEKQLQHPFILHKLKTRQPEYIAWILENLKPDDNVGIDAQLFSIVEFEVLKKELETKHITITDVGDLFKDIWSDRPPLPNNSIILHDNQYNFLNRNQKIEKIRSYLAKNNNEQILITFIRPT